MCVSRTAYQNNLLINCHAKLILICHSWCLQVSREVMLPDTGLGAYCEASPLRAIPHSWGGIVQNSVEKLSFEPSTVIAFPNKDCQNLTMAWKVISNLLTKYNLTLTQDTWTKFHSCFKWSNVDYVKIWWNFNPVANAWPKAWRWLAKRQSLQRLHFFISVQQPFLKHEGKSPYRVLKTNNSGISCMTTCLHHVSWHVHSPVKYQCQWLITF